MSQNAQPAASASFDSRPLTMPVTRATVRDAVRRLRAGGTAASGPAVGNLLVGVVVAFIAVVIIVIAASVIGAVISSGSGVAGILPIVFLALVVGGGGTLLYVAWRGNQERMYRLDAFARANGMSYVPAVSDPRLPGMIFSIGGSRRASDLVRGTSPRFVEFGNYQYTTGSGKNRSTHEWGYVAVKLDVPLPNIVLDATSNNSVFGTNLPASFDKGQRLSLEGDFDQHFSLYCPKGYERDALYLFTPDIMARFIDNAAALDVEIADDWLFLYSRQRFSTLDPRMWAWLFSVVHALLDKLAQWARWRDDRLAVQPDAAAAASASLPAPTPGATPAPQAAAPFAAPAGFLRPPPGVAAPGRRLRRSFPWPAFVVAAVFIIAWIVLQSGFLFR